MVRSCIRFTCPVGQASHHSSQLEDVTPYQDYGESPFHPASRIEGQSLPWGWRYPFLPNGRAIASLVRETVVDVNVTARPPCCHGLERTDRTVASIFVGAFDPVHTLPFFLTGRKAETIGTLCSPNEQFLYPSLKSKGLHDLHLH